MDDKKHTMRQHELSELVFKSPQKTRALSKVFSGSQYTTKPSSRNETWGTQYGIHIHNNPTSRGAERIHHVQGN